MQAIMELPIDFVADFESAFVIHLYLSFTIHIIVGDHLATAYKAHGADFTWGKPGHMHMG